MAHTVVLVDPVLGALTCDRLTPSFRVYQRAEGHRFSSDDMVTAFEAHRARPAAERVLDLGSGLGSVLLTLAWKLPKASFVGIEAQSASFELLRRNVDMNALGDRVRIHHGDLRDASLLAGVGSGYDLVTGTPPYFPTESAKDARDEQRTRARIETRGGVEVYIEAASQVVADDGALVICGDARAKERVDRAVLEAKLFVHHRTDVIAKEGRAPLFSVWTIVRTGEEATLSALTLRDSQGRKTADAQRLRVFSGFEPVLDTTK